MQMSLFLYENRFGETDSSVNGSSAVNGCRLNVFDQWCFYQLFGLSFWRHPFTAEDPLVSKWCTATFLQICFDEETNSSTSLKSVKVCLNWSKSWPSRCIKKSYVLTGVKNRIPVRIKPGLFIWLCAWCVKSSEENKFYFPLLYFQLSCIVSKLSLFSYLDLMKAWSKNKISSSVFTTGEEI